MANAYYKNGSSWINMANVFYPVGAYYLANTSTSPSSLFGGTWTPITGRFPYFNAGTGTGGSNTHTLTANEMPSHAHTQYGKDAYGEANGAAALDTTRAGTANLFNNRLIVTGTRSTASAGGNSAHNNMPAYKTCYCWYRTA